MDCVHSFNDCYAFSLLRLQQGPDPKSNQLGRLLWGPMAMSPCCVCVKQTWTLRELQELYTKYTLLFCPSPDNGISISSYSVFHFSCSHVYIDPLSSAHVHGDYPEFVHVTIPSIPCCMRLGFLPTFPLHIHIMAQDDGLFALDLSFGNDITLDNYFNPSGLFSSTQVEQEWPSLWRLFQQQHQEPPVYTSPLPGEPYYQDYQDGTHTHTHIDSTPIARYNTLKCFDIGVEERKHATSSTTSE